MSCLSVLLIVAINIFCRYLDQCESWRIMIRKHYIKRKKKSCFCCHWHLLVSSQKGESRLTVDFRVPFNFNRSGKKKLTSKYCHLWRIFIYFPLEPSLAQSRKKPKLEILPQRVFPVWKRGIDWCPVRKHLGQSIKSLFHYLCALFLLNQSLIV